MTWGVLQDDLEGITRWLGGYYKMTWGVLQENFGGGGLQDNLGYITK